MQSGKATESPSRTSLWACYTEGCGIISTSDRGQAEQIDVETRARQSEGASNNAIYEMVARAIAARHPGGGVLVDIGCGAGKLWSFVGECCDRYIGVDVVRYDGFPADAEFIIHNLDAGKIPLADGCADMVVSVETIEHCLLPRRSSGTAEFVDEQLPWGMPIRVRPLEEHGRIISTLGVIDLAVTETLWRLTDPGELAVDVGANIGYMTAVLAVRVGSILGGCVRAFEAHPEIFQELKYNTLQWQKQLTGVKLDIQQVAISDKRGTVKLVIPDAFSSNRGLAYVVNEEDDDLTHLRTVIIEAVTLDELFTQSDKIGVIKLDVEGHELQVLKGSKSLLKEQRVRDWVFEEHGEYPTAVTRYFEEMGYSVFRIQRQFFKPVLLVRNSKIARNKWLPTSFIATAARTGTQSVQRTGWAMFECLKGHYTHKKSLVK